MSTFKQILQLERAQLETKGLSHTPFEIDQQPDLWREMLPHLKAFLQTLKGFWDADDKQRPVVLVGAGTSAYAAQAVGTALKQRGWSHVEAIASTELLLDPAGLFPREPFTMISFARSGNSPEGNAAFTLASELQPRARHIVVTCNRDGELARLAADAGDEHARTYVLPERSNDEGLAMTSSFTGMVIAGQALAYVDEQPFFAKAVEELAAAGEALLEDQSDAIGHLAALPFERAVFIGAGSHYATALESHLKVQELTDGHVVAKTESMLGIRHGPMTVIDKNTLVAVFLSRDAYAHPYEIDLLRELRSKNLGLQTVVCVPAGMQANHPDVDVNIEDLADVIVPVGPGFGEETGDDARDEASPPTVPDPLRVAPTVLFGQLLGLMKSVHLGLTPDAPSEDDVISRVVQGVTIYPYPGP